MKLMKHATWLVGLVLAASAVGCWPRTRIQWSPDSKCALVMGEKGLYLCNDAGKVSPSLADDVVATAWMPDSRGFIAARRTTLSGWKELQPYLSEDRKKILLADADTFLKEILAYQGDWDKFQPVSKPRDILSVLLYLRDEHGDELARHLGKVWEEKKEEMFKATRDLFEVRLYAASGLSAKPGKVLLNSLEMVYEIRVAADGKAFAYAAGTLPQFVESGADSLSLFAAPTAPDAAPVHVANLVSPYFDWSPDGQAVVFARATAAKPEGKDVLRLGSVTRQVVRGQDGAIPAELPPPQDLAAVLFYDTLRVRCLHDGRALFAASQVHLPAASKDMPQKLDLYTAAPAEPVTVARLLPDEAAKDMDWRLDLLEVSPKGDCLSVPGSNGLVYVLKVATGEVVTAQAMSQTGGELWTVPVWRSANELCFTVPPGADAGSPGRTEIVLWSSKGARCISKAWPDEVINDFLAPRNAPSTQPAPPPAEK